MNINRGFFQVAALIFLAGMVGGLATYIRFAPPQQVEALRSLSASLFNTQQGGTGTSSPSGILIGDNGATQHLSTLTIGTNLSLVGTTLSATGGGSGSAYPFTPTTNYNAATGATTTPVWFQQGFQASTSKVYFEAITVASTTASSTIKSPLLLDNAPTNLSNFLNITASRVYPASITTGGMVHIDNSTVNSGTGLEVISGYGSGATGRTIVFNETNTAFDQDFILASSSASNTTVLNLKGFPTGKGIIKIEHTGSGTGFANASALSIDLLNATDAQGIFIKESASATGKPLNIVDSGSVAIFSISAAGLVTLANNVDQFLYTSHVGAVIGAASSSLFGYTPLNPTRAITVAGTANQITSSAGSQDLSADRTWTLSFPTLIINPNASTTLFSNLTKAYFGATATTTIDSTGNVVIPSGSNLTITGKTDGCATFATGVLNSTGSACGAGGGTTFGKAWEIDAGGQLAPTTTIAVSIPTWLSINDQTFAYASSTTFTTLLGIGAGGNAATTSNAVTETTAIGTNALAKNQAGGFWNTAVGSGALSAVSTGDDNTAVGRNAGVAVTTSARNVFVGSNSDLLGTGNGNILLGAYLSAPANNGYLSIGNILFGNNSYNTSVVSGAAVVNGRIGVSTTSPFATFSVHAPDGSTNLTLFAIGSSTPTATSSLFTVANTGVTTINATSSGSVQKIFSVQTAGGSDRFTVWSGSGNFSFGQTSSGWGTTLSGGVQTIGRTNGDGTITNGTEALEWINNDTISGIPGTFFIGTHLAARDTVLTRLSAGVLQLGTSNNNTANNAFGTFITERIGLGTTTPFAQFALVATSTNGLGSPTTLFTIASTTRGTATSTLFSIGNTGIGSLSLGSTTQTFSAVQGLFTQGANGANGSSTYSAGKLQMDLYNTAGTRSCMFVVGTTLTVVANACTP